MKIRKCRVEKKKPAKIAVLLSLPWIVIIKKDKKTGF
jgi:hypothetical protein